MSWEIDFADMCRGCMKTEGKLLDMFLDDEIKDLDLARKLSDLTAVKIDQSNGLPMMLCGECAYKTNSYYKFKQQVQETEKKLFAMLNSHVDDMDEPKVNRKRGRPKKKPPPSGEPPTMVPSNPSPERMECLEVEENLIQILQPLEESTEIIEIPNPESTESRKYPEIPRLVPKKTDTHCTFQIVDATRNHKRIRIETQKWQPLFTTGTDADGEISDDEELEIDLLEEQNVEITETMENNDDETEPNFGAGNDDVIKIKESHMNDGKAMYQCTLCQTNFDKLTDALLHNVNLHVSESGPFYCMVCEKDCADHNQLQSHVKIHTGQFPYTCFLCYKSYSMKRYLKRHMASHVDFPRYRCSKCGIRYKSKAELEEHISTHFNGAPFECAQCSRLFSHKANYKRHLTTHDLDPIVLQKYTCDFCNKQFLNNRTLTTHRRVHTGERPYKCTICDKSFSQQGNLINHEKIHTNPRNFACDVCGKSFNQRSTLKDHSLLHTGEKPYVCSVCNMAFTFSAALRRHQWSHADGKPFRCHTCDAGFVGKYDLKRHVKIHGAKAIRENKEFSLDPLEADVVEVLEDAEEFQIQGDQQGQMMVQGHEDETVLVEQVFMDGTDAIEIIEDGKDNVLYSLIQCG